MPCNCKRKREYTHTPSLRWQSNQYSRPTPPCSIYNTPALAASPPPRWQSNYSRCLPPKPIHLPPPPCSICNTPAPAPTAPPPPPPPAPTAPAPPPPVSIVEDDFKSSFTPDYRTVQNLGVECIKSLTKHHDKHEPDAITGLPEWPKWDGVTKAPRSQMKPDKNPVMGTDGKPANAASLTAFFFPNNNYQMRGLRDLFYTVKPFADVSNPTVREIEDWHVEVINLLRRMTTLRSNDAPTIKKDANLFLAANFSDERRESTIWDEAYPDKKCLKPTNDSHCGYNWFPNPMDQQPYFEQEGQKAISNTAEFFPAGSSEGVFSVGKEYNWSVKLAKIFYDTMRNESDNWHMGPPFGRSRMGSSFYCKGDFTTVRLLWS
jgi:hypothetical protein